MKVNEVEIEVIPKINEVSKCVNDLPLNDEIKTKVEDLLTQVVYTLLG